MVFHLHKVFQKSLLLTAVFLCFGISQIWSQTNLGSLDNTSMSCNLSFPVCEGDTVRLAPSNTTGFTNFQWYYGSIDVANEINGADPARGVHSVGNDTVFVIAPGGIYILTAEYSTSSGCMALNDTITLDYQAVPDLSTITASLCIGNGETVDLNTLVTDGNSVSGTTSWFATLGAAQNNSGALSGTVVNPAVDTKYYVRKTSGSSGGCYDIDSTTVIVNPMPTATGASLTECETTSGGGDAVFTLSETNLTVLDGQLGMTLTFHGSQSDADNNLNAITAPTATDGTIVYARVENSDGCYATSTITLNVDPLPTATPAFLTLCETTSGGGTAMFTLSDATLDVLNSQMGMTVTYHATQADADNGASAITTSTSIDGTSVYVRVENTDGCYATSTITLNVDPLPTATPASLTLCETTSGGGTAVFTLSDATLDVLNSQMGMTVTYHATQADADNGASAITTSTSIDGTSVYVRVENTDGCYATSTITLNVDPLPTATPASLTLCETISGGGTAVFTLSDATLDVLNSQMGMTVTYHATQADADNGASAITTSTSTDGTSVYVRVENTDGCYATAAVTLNVDPLPTATPAVLTLCETTTEGGTAVFTLSDATLDVLNSQMGMTVTYHATQADADNGASVITSSTSSNGDVVYVRVENTDGCYATAPVTLNVNTRPAFTLSLPDNCPGEDPTISISLGAGAEADPNVVVNGGTAFSYSTLTMGVLEVANGVLLGANNTVVLTNSTGCDETKSITTPSFQPEVCIPLSIDVFRK